VSLLLSWDDNSGMRHVDFSGLSLFSFSSFLTLAMISFACSPYSTSWFQVRHSATPIWARSVVCRLWWQVSTSVDCIMSLKHRSTILWNLSRNILMDSPFFYLVAMRVGTDTSVSPSKKWAKKSFPRSAQFLMESAGSFMNHSKATPLRVPMKNQARMVSFDTTFSVWDLK